MTKFKALLAHRIKYLREQRGITQQTLSERSGLNVAVIAHYELGNRQPLIEQFLKLCTGLGVTTNEFFNMSGDGYKTWNVSVCADDGHFHETEMHTCLTCGAVYKEKRK